MRLRCNPSRRITKSPGFAGLIGLLSLGVALAGCPGTLESPERFAPSTGSGPGAGGGGGSGGGGGNGSDCDVPKTLALSCGAMPNCHSSEEPSAALDLVSPGFEARVLNQPSSTEEACSGSVLADPMDPENSLLYTKTLVDVSCGLRMPLGGPFLNEEETACLLEWIAGLGDAGSGGAGGAGGGAGGS